MGLLKSIDKRNRKYYQGHIKDTERDAVTNIWKLNLNKKSTSVYFFYEDVANIILAFLQTISSMFLKGSPNVVHTFPSMADTVLTQFYQIRNIQSLVDLTFKRQQNSLFPLNMRYAQPNELASSNTANKQANLQDFSPKRAF